MNVAFVCLLFIIGKATAGDDCPKDKDLSTEGKLRRKIFCNYDKKIRPVRHFDNTTKVEFQLFPIKIFLNYYQHSFKLEGHVLYVWTDEFLQWDPREYEGIDFLRVKEDEIWLPDITTLSLDEYSSSSLTDRSNCHLTHTGYVYCIIQGTIFIPCTFDVTFYPYEAINCSINFFSRGFTGKHINLTIYNAKDPIHMSLYTPNKEWELKKATAERQVKYIMVEGEKMAYPIIKCTFTLWRHSAGRFTVIILPAVVLAGLTLLIFWLDSKYSIRLGIAFIVMICDALYLIYLANDLSPNGDKSPVLVVFIRDSFAIASFSIIVTTLVCNMRMKTEKPSRILTDVIAKMESISIVKFVFFNDSSVKSEDTEEIIENAKNSPSEWEQLAVVIDRSSFIFCCLIYIVLLNFYLPRSK